jgi:hypothetical protein
MKNTGIQEIVVRTINLPVSESDSDTPMMRPADQTVGYRPWRCSTGSLALRVAAILPQKSEGDLETVEEYRGLCHFPL